jgi:predicted  nucleic acid-binding Zn-ribbon protein
MLRRLLGFRRFKPKPIELGNRKLKKWNKLKDEFDTLREERSRLREEIGELDQKLARGEIGERERDKEFRLRLSKAGEISRRLVDVVGEMTELGKIPEEYQE